jgi:hypothetical protein
VAPGNAKFKNWGKFVAGKLIVQVRRQRPICTAALRKRPDCCIADGAFFDAAGPRARRRRPHEDIL